MMLQRTEKRTLARLASFVGAGLLMLAAETAQAGLLPEMGTTCTTVTLHDAGQLPVWEYAQIRRDETLGGRCPEDAQSTPMPCADRRRRVKGEIA